MEAIHEIMMRKTKSSINALRSQLNFINKLKQKISHDVLTETLIKKQDEIKLELQGQGAIVSNKFKDVLKNMKRKNFDLVSQLNKIEKDLDGYYDISQRDDTNNCEKKEKKIKTKKIVKNQKFCKTNKVNENKKTSFIQPSEVKNSEQIFEQSLEQYKVLQNS